jgi:hypothetical protein
MKLLLNILLFSLVNGCGAVKERTCLMVRNRNNSNAN